jgi:hypothetical protein
MCLFDNNAEHEVHYVGAQLKALYHIANQCLAQYDEQDVPKNEKSYDLALAYFSHENIEARFNEPRLSFVCAHDALIKIEIAEAETKGKSKPPVKP